jgi:hypothetical protein
MTELTFCRKRLKEVTSRLAVVELFEKQLQELGPLHSAEQTRLSELKNAYRLELTCWKLTFRSHVRRSKQSKNKSPKPETGECAAG